MHLGFGPPKYFKTQVNSHGVEGVNHTIKVENLSGTLLSCLLNHEENELFEDAAIPIFVGVRQVASRHTFSYDEVVKLALMGLKDNVVRRGGL